jgi:sugar phosphate isomerase/epimerase
VRYISAVIDSIDEVFNMSQLARRNFLKNFLAASTAAFIPAPTWGATETAAALRIFKLGAISDGFSDDFEEALKLMKGYGLEWVEIRHIWGHVYNTEASPEQIRRVRELLDQYGFHVSVVSTAFYKCTLPGTTPVGKMRDAYPYAEQMEMLKRAADRAHAWGTETLRVFTFWRVAEPEKIAERVAEELEKAAEVARRAGVRLAIEDEGACNVKTGHELARLLAAVKAPNVGANWDVGNPVFSGEVSFPSGYDVLPKNRIWHMHVKGVACETPGKQCHDAPADQGSIDLVGQFRALRRDHYTGTISLECEYKAPGMSHLQTTQRSMEGLLKVAAEAAA